MHRGKFNGAVLQDMLASEVTGAVGGSVSSLGVVGQRRDLFKMKGIGAKTNTFGNLPKQ